MARNKEHGVGRDPLRKGHGHLLRWRGALRLSHCWPMVVGSLAPSNPPSLPPIPVFRF